jgi:hypothetical protein
MMHNGNKKAKCSEQLASPRLFGWLTIALSISWSGAETETHVFKKTIKLKYQRTLMTKMRKHYPTLATLSQPTLFSLVPTFKISLVFWGSFSFVHFPTLFFEQYFCQTCPTLFSGGHDHQKIYAHVDS